MDPAPGYDEFLPHDLLHFVVEAELGLSLGVFGQLAAGGDAGTFYLASASNSSRETSRHRRRIKKRGQRLVLAGRRDAALSERAVGVFEHEWPARSSAATIRRHARVRWKASVRDAAKRAAEECELFSEETIRRVCRRLDQVSARWSHLQVGESMTLPWVAEG